jgi:hypothetical protein
LKKELGELELTLMARNGMSVFGLLPLIAMGLAYLGVGRAENASPEDAAEASIVATCERSLPPPPLKEALRPVCVRTHATGRQVSVRSVIIIGFVGGFARNDDLKHPEVNFAALFRGSYPSVVHADVFANHNGDSALRRVLQLVDSDEDGVITASEKEQANVIIYGHSWGASQTVELARGLGRYGVPVILTVQVDSVRKPGQEDSTIPPNVKNAINFYQTRGPIHGRSMIRAADPGKTNIVGNFQMTYRNRRINCANYPWLARHFNKPHHEIENDPQVWDQVASLIDAELLRPAGTAQH